MTIENLIQRLKQGNQNFVKNKCSKKAYHTISNKKFINKEYPEIIIVSCGNNEVIPELMFDASLGALHVIRVTENNPDMSSLGRLEYAIAHSKSKLIVVVGHHNCDTLNGIHSNNTIDKKINYQLSKKDIKSTPNNPPNCLSKSHAKKTVKQIIRNSGIIKDAVVLGRVAVVPVFYNVSSGLVDFL